MDREPLGRLPGERVLWEGRPNWRSLVHPNFVIIIPVRAGLAAVVSVLVAVFVNAALGLFEAPGTEPGAVASWVFGVAVVYQVVSNVVRAFVLWRTRYLLTDRRVVVMADLSGRRTTSAHLNALGYPVLKEASNGSGRITFAGSVSTASRRGSTPVLRQLADGRRVRALVVEAQRAVLPAIVASPVAPAAAVGTPRAPARQARTLRRATVAIAALGLLGTGAGTAMLVRYWPTFSIATATSCTQEFVPSHSKGEFVYDCEVTWTDHAGGRVGTYHGVGPAIPSPGTKFPVLVRGNTASYGGVMFMAYGILAVGLVTLALAVVSGVVEARQARVGPA